MIVNLYLPTRLAQGELQSTFGYAIKVIDKILEEYFGVCRIHRDRYVGNALNILINDTGLAIHDREISDVWWTDTILFPFHYDFIPNIVNGLFKTNVVLSNYVKRHLEELGVRVDYVIPYPIDDVLFDFWNGYEDRKFDVLFIGKTYPEDRKNIKLSYELFNELKVKAVMVTNAKLKNTQYVKILPATQLSEVMKGRLLSSAKVFFFPSKSEGMGMPVFEAMAVGTPVIYTKGHGTEHFAYGIGIKPLHWYNSFSQIGRAKIFVYSKEELKEALEYVISLDKDEWTELHLRTKLEALNVFTDILDGMRKILNTPKSEFNTIRLYELKEAIKYADGYGNHSG